MKNAVDRPSTAIQGVQAALIWIALATAEHLAAFFLRSSPQVLAYYLGALGLTSLVFIAIPLLGKQPIVADIHEICFYDVLVQVYGLYLFSNGFDTASYVKLAQMITIIKMLRLSWPVFSTKLGLPQYWPTFGLIGLLWSKLIGHRAFVFTLQDKRKMYAMLGFMVPVAFAIQTAWAMSAVPLPGIITVLAAFYGVKKLITHLETKEEEHRQTQRALDQAEFAAEADAKMILALKDKNAEIERQALELAAKNTQLEALSAERAAMSADLTDRNISLRDASHDFKVPLLRLTSLLDQAQDYATHAKQIDILDQLDKGVEEVRSMMGDLIEQAKVSTEMNSSPIQRLQVADLGEYFYSRLQEQAKKRSVSFDVRATPCAVRTNEILLRRIIINLANNAILYAQAGTRVTVRFHHSDTRCYVRVYDNGSGIADANGSDRVANFSQMIDTIKQRRQPITPNPAQAQGHGLGLQIVKRLCGEIGSTITLQSIPGVGTCFRFSLPLAD